MDHSSRTKRVDRAEKGIALKIALIYSVVGILWILFSDQLLLRSVPDPNTLTYLQTFKGWLYILATSVLLYVLIRRYAGSLTRLMGRLRISEERIRHLVDSVPDILYTARLPDFEVTFISPAVTAALGFTPEDFAANPYLLQDQLHDDDRHRVLSEIRLASTRLKTFTVEYRTWHKDGKTVRWFRDSGNVHEDENHRIASISGAMSDITERKETETRTAYMANHDSLTGLLNQRGLVLVLESFMALARRRRQEMTCLILGIDGFGHINDAYGRRTGDDLLVQIGHFLERTLRASDTISHAGDHVIARVGGNRFLMVLPDTRLKGAQALGERVLKELVQLKIPAGTEYIRVTGKVGIAGFPAHAEEADSLLSHAETALKRARSEGAKPIHVFDNAEREEDTQALRCVEAIHSALEEKRFMLHFQPIMHIPSGELRHYEVLVRMQAPDGRLIPPGQFIEVAERFGMINQIDYRVLEMAFEHLKKLARHRRRITLSVNLSGAHFGDTHLLQWLERKFTNSGIDTRNLILEITETAAVRDMQKARNLMQSLKALGYRFALDDFGIGFTSFSHLRTLPVDIVKIDGSFVRNLHTSREDRGLVQAIINVARTFNKEVVAEFVENGEILKILQRFGVDYAQGFHIGRPEPSIPLNEASQGDTENAVPHSLDLNFVKP